MANPLDLLARGLLRMGGMSPQQIRQQSRANKPSKPMPRPSTARVTSSRPAGTPNGGSAPVTQRRGGVSGTARDRVTTGNGGSRVTTGNNRPTGSNTTRVTSSQTRGSRVRSAQAGGRGGATATGTGARPANQPRGGAPVTQGGGGNTPNRGALQTAANVAGVAANLRRLTPLGVAATVLAPTPTSSRDTQAANRGTPRRAPSPYEKAQYKRDEAAARARNAQRDKTYNSTASGFDDAFRSARRAGVATFTWNGKQYTTKTK